MRCFLSWLLMLLDLVRLPLTTEIFLFSIFAEHGMLSQKKSGIDTKMMRYDKEENTWIF